MARFGVQVRAVVIVVAFGAALSMAMSPASATVYSTPGDEVVVATEGEDASATVLAVSNGGDADAPDGAALTTTGTASGEVAVSATGDASNDTPTGVTVAGGGQAQGGAVVVAWGDAESHGSLVLVTLTGDGQGATILSVCPFGHCE
ncbi:MAG: hypothetical protein M3394_03695 [Actinomycetota bacterium]|nr:hypothetical protein [Actinomycetota bacterium]